MSSDGTLARVTYLPGVTPPADTNESLQSEKSELSEERKEQVHLAQKVSMRALTRRGMSRWELGSLLQSQELDTDIVETELDRLERVGLIDDRALAETIVRTQHERKGLGKSALTAELRRRHVDQAVIDEAMGQLSQGDEESRAGALAERRAAQLQGLDHDTAVRRLSGYLQRKGYSGETVRHAVIAALPKRSTGVLFR